DMEFVDAVRRRVHAWWRGFVVDLDRAPEIACPALSTRWQRRHVVGITDETRAPVAEIEQPGLEVIPFGPAAPPGVGLHADTPTDPRPRPERRDRPWSEDRLARCDRATVEDVTIVDGRLDAVG